MLTIVPTPLGNLEDMTPRALKALREASAVYCEDTRRTRALMSHFGISTPLLRYHEQDARDVRGMLERLKSGASLALVSDGGLPCISDPGRRIVAAARQAGLAVTALPGGTAVATALSGSGLPGDSFVFLGFLPRSRGRQVRELKEAATLERTLVVYESPFRVVDLLSAAAEALGAQAQCCVVRELSKIHEEWLWGTITDVRSRLSEREKQLGEFVVMLHPRPLSQEDPHVASH
jgi:16S rRNA (cytidine1402-2'-O)-methyltransferase